MKLKTFQKVPVLIELDCEEESEVVSHILQNTYWDLVDQLDDKEREAFSIIYTHYSGLDIERIRP